MKRKPKSAAESWTYVIESDRTLDPAEQTRFVLAPLTTSERQRARDNLNRQTTDPDGAVVIISRARQVAMELALSHIESIENFPVGAPIAWPADRDDRIEYLEMLNDDDVYEIGNEIWTRSKLGSEGATVKNSLPPERTSSSGGAEARDSTPAPDAPNNPR